MVHNNFDRIFIDQAGKIERTDATFADNAHLLRIISKIVSQVGRRWTEGLPMVDARAAAEVNAIIPPLLLGPSNLHDPEVLARPYTMDDLIAFDTLTAKSAQFLAACVARLSSISGRYRYR